MVLRYNQSVNAKRQQIVAGLPGASGEDAADAVEAFVCGLPLPQ